MDAQEIVSVLRYIDEYALASKEQFARHRHFYDKGGKSMEPSYRSLPEAERKCIGGGVIEGLSALGKKDINSYSAEYRIVMSALADTLGLEGAAIQKVRAVQKFNNTKGYAAVRNLIRKTIARLES